MDIFLNQLRQCYWNNMINLCPLTAHIVVLYPQNGNRIVTIDYVTSLNPMCQTTTP